MPWKSVAKPKIEQFFFPVLSKAHTHKDSVQTCVFMPLILSKAKTKRKQIERPYGNDAVLKMTMLPWQRPCQIKRVQPKTS